MPNYFHSFKKNGNYCVGCTGQGVYVYDREGNELAKFKDLIYAYDFEFSPKGDIFVVQSKLGRLAVYSLEKLCLVKKFRFAKSGTAQDHNFCFSSDGEKFYILRQLGNGSHTALSVYDAEDFSLEKEWFAQDDQPELNVIEFDGGSKALYALGRERNKDGFPTGCFVAKITDERLDRELITHNEYDFYESYKRIEFMGEIPENPKEGTVSDFWGVDPDVVRQKRHSLAKLWSYYRGKRSLE